LGLENDKLHCKHNIFKKCDKIFYLWETFYKKPGMPCRVYGVNAVLDGRCMYVHEAYFGIWNNLLAVIT
jgi:hypothetical protein